MVCPSKKRRYQESGVGLGSMVSIKYDFDHMPDIEASLGARREIVPRVGDYRTILEAADRRRASSQGKPPSLFVDDPKTAKVLETWVCMKDKEWNEERVRAAELVSDLLIRGNVDVTELCNAVAPESLKDVLLRAGADYSVLMLIGEGQIERDEAIAFRRANRMEAEGWLASFQGMIRSLAEKRWKSVVDADKTLTNFEAKDRWSKAEMLLFRGARTTFERALNDFRAMHDDYLRGQKKV